MDFVKLELRAPVAIVTLDRPDCLNALNNQVYEEIIATLQDVEKNSDIKVVILTGSGKKAFAAGADIAQMVRQTAIEGRFLGGLCHKAANLLENMRQVTIAAVNGFALGGGCELAMACDIRIASMKARFGQPEVGLGIIPGFSGTYRLPKLVGQGIAKELIYTGKMIDADEAYRIGLVNSVVAPEELAGAVDAMIAAICKNAPIAVSYAKTCIGENYDLDVDESIALENQYFAKCFATDDQKEGMAAFLGKRPAAFKNQ